MSVKVPVSHKSHNFYVLWEWFCWVESELEEVQEEVWPHKEGEATTCAKEGKKNMSKYHIISNA